jgi:hypothetical protein
LKHISAVTCTSAGGNHMILFLFLLKWPMQLFGSWKRKGSKRALMSDSKSETNRIWMQYYLTNIYW